MEMHINKPQCHHRKGWVYIYIRAIDPRLAGEYVLHDSCHYCEGGGNGVIFLTAHATLLIPPLHRKEVILRAS